MILWQREDIGRKPGNESGQAQTGSEGRRVSGECRMTTRDGTIDKIMDLSTGMRQDERL